jgi:hypothetical protein
MNMTQNKKLCGICHHYFDRDDMIILRHHYGVGWICQDCYKHKKW